MIFLFTTETKEGAMLKIIRVSQCSSSVNGGEEVWLLADKLNGTFLVVNCNWKILRKINSK